MNNYVFLDIMCFLRHAMKPVADHALDIYVFVIK